MLLPDEVPSICTDQLVQGKERLLLPMSVQLHEFAMDTCQFACCPTDCSPGKFLLVLEPEVFGW